MPVDPRSVKLARKAAIHPFGSGLLLLLFLLGSYDRSRPSIIDPAFVFSTFHGGTGAEQGYGIAVDAAGNVFLTGYTASANFPLRQPLQNNLRGTQDAFVTKFSPAGELVWSTYLGGSGADSGSSIALDPDGSVYVGGTTGSADFPLKNPFITQGPPRGVTDSFLVKLNDKGDQILSATVFGGGGLETPRAISVDSSRNVWLAGHTSSVDFPLRNPFQKQARGREEIFIVKVSGAGDLLFSTYLGGSQIDRLGSAIANDLAGNAYIAGATESSDFPVTTGAVQPVKRNGIDAFVTKIRSDGTGLIFSTFLGGNADDTATSIAINSGVPDGEAYITGGTSSTDFPVTAGVFQPLFAGGASFGGDAFVTRLDASGRALVFSTYLGGAGPEQGTSIAVDLSGSAYVAGRTSQEGSVGAPPTFPLVNPLQRTFGGSFFDGFISCVNASGASLSFSTFLGGSEVDMVDAIAVDLLHNIYVTGNTLSGNFPSVNSAQPSIGGSLSDAFAAKVKNNAASSSLASVSAASYSGEALASESIVVGFGSNLAPATSAAETIPLPLSMAGTHVVITDSKGSSFPASLFYVSPGQVNFYIPSGVADGAATISLFSSGNRMAAGGVSIAPVAPGLFAANSNGRGVAAAVALRVKANGSLSYEPVARFDAARNEFVAAPIDLGSESDRVFLILFATGLRHVESPARLSVTMGGESAEVSYAGAQGAFLGLDQVNILIPRALAGKGEVEIGLSVGGRAANKPSVFIK